METINEPRAQQSIVSSRVVCHNERQPTSHLRHLTTSMFSFLFTYHKGLSVVVVNDKNFLSGDVMHVVTCKWWLIGEQRVVCHVSRSRHVKNLWDFNCLIWHSEHFTRQKYLGVWSWHKTRCNVCITDNMIMIISITYVYWCFRKKL